MSGSAGSRPGEVQPYDRRRKSGFGRARAIAQSRRQPLRFGLSIDPGAPELHQLRWETLREPEEHTRLLIDENILFSRFLEGVSVPLRPLATLRALVVVANPVDLAKYGFAPLNTETELQRARMGLGNIDRTELAGRGRSTLSEIVAHLREGYDILFLICHGAIRDDEAQLWLEDATGNAKRIPARELADSIRDLARHPRLIVLASCQSAGDGGEARGQDDGALTCSGLA